jgi:outer membrane receptor protein involved in Fe transport
MVKISLHILTIIILSINILAQNKTGTVYGFVDDEGSGNPIPFVNVLLLKSSDSTVIKGITANKTGRFELTDINDGNYLLKFSCIGFRDFIKSGIKISAAGRKLNTGTTSLISSITDLEEVVITSKKETFNNGIDRKVYNVENDIMSKSGSASDLLQNIPSVSVDIDGNVSLRGSQNCMIMINGKTSPLMDKSSATVLDELPSNSIERIEVITNPSAGYKPDGTSGIINIVLKKDVGTGFNSNVTLNVGNNSRYNGNINFNYNPGKFNVFGNYGYRLDYRGRLSSETRTEIISTGTQSYFNDNGHFYGRPVAHLGSLGADYNVDKFNKLSLSGNYFYQDGDRSGVDAQLYTYSDNTIPQDFDRVRKSNEMQKEYDATFGYLHNFGQEDHDLEIEAKTSSSPELESNNYTDNFRTPVIPSTYDDDAITQKEYRNEISVKYKLPFSDKSSFESGYLGEFISSIRDMYVDYYDPITKSFLQDFTKTSSFHLNMSSNAFYSTYKNEIGNLGFMAGVRAENVEMKPQLITLNSTFTNNYFNFFPSLHLNYNLNETASLQLNYSKRIHRPHDDDLNPFPEYQDPRNIRAGNPNLKPEYINSLEFGCQFQYENITFTPGIYYRYTTNRFTQIISQVNDSVLLTTQMNLASDKSGGVELVASSSIKNLFSMQVSLNGFYNQIDATNLGYFVKSSAYSWDGTLSFNFNVTSSTMFQVNSNYRSIRLTPQGETSPSYAVNCGLRQDLLNEKISLVLTVSDLFNSMKWKNTLNTADLYDYSVRQRDGRIMFFGVTYHFGRPDKKKEKMEYDDSMN